MKRSLGNTLWIGSASAVVVVLIQKFGLLSRPEGWLLQRFFGVGLPNDGIRLTNYFFVVLLGVAVAWTILQVEEISRRIFLLALLLFELASITYVLGLAGIFFQPLPAILVSLFAAAGVIALDFTTSGRHRRATLALFSGRLSESEMQQIAEGPVPDLTHPKSYDVSFIFCEIANEADLIEDLSPDDCARVTREFINLASALFLKEGGYLQAADGEGIRVLFGFPHSLGNHAAAAARTALLFRDRVAVEAFKKPDSLGKIEIGIGVSSGVIVAAAPEEARHGHIVISGEPIEIARRLAIANQTYGSQILLGPRVFSEAGAEIVARPIDFLRSAQAHDRLEVYELLALAADASAEEIARRDCFWKGLVYFRERKWNESFAEFSRARRANGESDAPLQWYLRRLEPVIAKISSEPAPLTDAVSPF